MVYTKYVCCILLIALICKSTCGSVLYLQIGDDFPQTLSVRYTGLIKSSSQYSIVDLKPLDQIPSNSTGSFIISLGTTIYTDKFINEELSQLGDEAFIVKVITQNGIKFVLSNGNPLTNGVPNNKNGLLYGAYTILELIGFGFFHPLDPTIPSTLNIDSLQQTTIKESPYWPIRGWHIHSMHPLELTNFLNGFGDGMSTTDEDWSVALDSFKLVLEWLVANKQNRLEWVLLCGNDWQYFCASTSRQNRMKTMTSLAHDYGIIVGADLPIAEIQQHAWYIIQHPDGTLEQQYKEIHDRMDWITEAGFDFLSTENGFSEFTHPTDTIMLAWMNETSRYLVDKYNKKAYIKIHCSTGQTCDHYKDPWTGKPLNFNFLPYYADPSLGIYPHTVQLYTWDDPAPTYGNTNFEYLLNFTFEEAGKREVIYHGETAYWVSFDINVPLFLPSYAYARLYDLRKIAQLEKKLNKKIQGQMNFDSGWEWGYWLQDVITARASWDPMIDVDIDTALLSMLNRITRVFGPQSQKMSQSLVDCITIQRDLLIYGKINGKVPSDIYKRNGVAYVEGWDTWDDIGCLLNAHACTQPNRLGLEQLRLPFQSPHYSTLVEPLLHEMADNFTTISQQLSSLSTSLPNYSQSLWTEIVDSATITALRAKQVYHLYQFVNGWLVKPSSWRQEQLNNAKSALASAETIVKQREASYRVPVSRIAGWGTNPTVYTYGYLWTTHSLFYWWRDLAKALDDNIDSLSPCYMNIINPIDVAFGEGIWLWDESQAAYFQRQEVQRSTAGKS